MKNSNMQNQQMGQNLNVSLDKTVPMVCENCGSEIFTTAFFLRKASKFITGTPQDALIPIPTFACAKCQHINSDMTVNENL